MSSIMKAGLAAVFTIEYFLSARRLAAAGEADLFPQGVDADRADHDLLADHVARGAVHPHRFRELVVLFQGGADFGAADILVELRHVDAGFLGRRKRAGLVGLAAAAEQLLVE